MNKLFSFFSILLLLSSFDDDKGMFIEKISISNFNYQVFKKSSPPKGDKIKTELYVLYGLGNKGSCSSVMLSTKNDSVIVSGNYTVFNDHIVFKEYYYKKNNKIDSISKVYYINIHGEFVLYKYTKYFEGKALN